MIDEMLRNLGHCYVLAETEHKNRVRHIAKVALSGEVLPVCGAKVRAETKFLGCPELWLDSDCEQCRAIENIKSAITKRSLMLNLVNQLCDIEQMFIDAMYWNYHNGNENPINPDPNGEMSQIWLDFQAQLILMMARFKPTMDKHEKYFGWAENFGEK